MRKKLEAIALRVGCFLFGHGKWIRKSINESPFIGLDYTSCGYCGKQFLITHDRFLG